jgi:nodulation protein E
MRRVVITGIGCITTLGFNASDFWGRLVKGCSGIGPITLVPREKLHAQVGAEVRGYVPEEWFDAKRLNLLDRFSQFAVVASREAVADAALSLSNGLGQRTAVILGTGTAGKTTDDEAFFHLYGESNPRVSPLVIPRLMASSATSHVTMEHNITGPAFTVSSACSSSTHAIGQAFWMVRAGVADLALAGGSEACFTLGTLKAWESMRVMAPDTCRPFSRNRRGMVLGEGGAVVVLEPLDAARRRGAKIYAELAGMGMSSDAGHITLPCEHGAARAMRAALDDARMQPADIDYVNAHGTGTTANDSTESRAIRQVFGEHARALAVSSTKSMHGHALGASGAIELVATVLALHYGIVPPTANFTEPDPECDLDCVPNQARERPIRAALSNSFAFGGLNAVLAVRRFDPDAA